MFSPQNVRQHTRVGFSPSPPSEKFLDAARLHGKAVSTGSPDSELLDPVMRDVVPAINPNHTLLQAGSATPSPELRFLTTHDLSADLFFPPVADCSSPSLSKLARGQRLPPFRLPGIGFPYLNRRDLPHRDSPFTAIGCGLLSNLEDPLHELSPTMSRASHLDRVGRHVPDMSSEVSTGVQSPFPGHLPAFTPPIDRGPIIWADPSRIKTATAGPQNTGTSVTSPAEDRASPAQGTAVPASQDATSTSSSDDKLWVEAAKTQILQTINAFEGDEVKVLSHALPSPSRTGHIFPTIVDAIHAHTESVPTRWINIFHAMPGRYKLSDIPTSPPATPGPMVGGVDYFAIKIFDSAVPVPDYQGSAKVIPPSPRPIVPPCSIHVSIVERFIPPTNVHEFAELFLSTGNSILTDRLVELAPTGSLVFVYPTKTGAKTFMDEYLGPVLDPILRSMAVVHGLSASLGEHLGAMESVDHLVEYMLLERKIKRFCAELSRDSTKLAKFHRKQASFSVVHSSREQVFPEQETWSRDWWVKQEKPRVRATVSKYYRAARNLPPDSDTMPTALIQEILDGVATKPYENGGPKRGVEVGVFVIRKTD